MIPNNKLEQAGKRVHLLLYGGDRENNPQYTEWRADLEVAISDWLKAYARSVIDEIVPELKSGTGLGKDIIEDSKNALRGILDDGFNLCIFEIKRRADELLNN